MDGRGADLPRGVRGRTLSAARLQSRVVRLGLLAAPVATAAAVLYLWLTPDAPHRVVAWSALAAAGLVTVTIAVVLRRSRLGRRATVGMLHGWVASQTLSIGVCAAADGGPGSPLTVLLFVPLVAGAVAFHPRGVVAQGAWSIAVVTAAGLVTGSVGVGGSLVWAVSLGIAAHVSSTTARSLVMSARDLDVANLALEEVARNDSLTACLNHGSFHDQVRLECDRRRRDGGQLALIVLDIDHFKRVNDEHGHPVGDEVLRDVADAVRGSVRPGDVVGRVGGEEFAVLLVDAELVEARRVAHRIHRAIGEAATIVTVTASLGVASGSVHALGPDDLFRAADDALYAAKRAGRDQVRCAGAGTTVDGAGSSLR